MTLKTTFIIFTTLFFVTACKQTNDQLFDRAYSLSRERKYEKAIEIYNELLQRNDRLQLAYYNRGFCYMSTKQYANALTDFNKVMDLQTYGNAILTFNKDMPYADEEVRAQVPYYDALYQRAQVKYHMDSIKSSFLDFQMLVDNDYEEKSNCIIWQGTIWLRNGSKDKACEYFQKARAVATTDEDRQNAEKYINDYCLQTNNNL